MATIRQRINNLKRKINSKSSEIDVQNAKIEKARKAVETLNAELSAANNELAILEGQLLTEMLIEKGIVISDVRAAVEAGVFDTPSAAPKAKEIILTTEKGATRMLHSVRQEGGTDADQPSEHGATYSTEKIPEENKADNLGITEQEENNDTGDS